MIHAATHTPARRVRTIARHALSFLFVCLITAVAHYSPLFPQICAQELQNNGSATGSEETQNSGCVNLEKSNDFEPVRLLRRDGLPVALETAVVRYSGEYQGTDGATRRVDVDLIGAIHMAEQPYYDEINRLFTQYNTVVFELVTDADADVALLVQEARNKEKRQKDSISLNPLNFVSAFQECAAMLFKLTYQIDGVDYAAPNLRRGDCSSVELVTETIKNGDFLDFFLTAAVQELVPADTEGELASVVALLCAADRRLVGKRFFAKELSDTTLDEFRGEARALEAAQADAKEGDAPVFAPHENAIIHFRNKKALAVLRQELDAGRTRVALFYGAAHLPDLGKRLETDFGLRRDPETQWLKAWSLE